jgi:hypothetical protein
MYSYELTYEEEDRNECVTICHTKLFTQKEFEAIVVRNLAEAARLSATDQDSRIIYTDTLASNLWNCLIHREGFFFPAIKASVYLGEDHTAIGRDPVFEKYRRDNGQYVAALTDQIAYIIKSTIK